MNTKIITIIGIIVFLMALFIGCGGNDSNPLGSNCNGLTWAEAYENEWQDVADAVTEFSEEQTVQSCNAYKSALQDWYNALDGLGQNCLIGVSEAQYEEALADAQQSIDEIDCTEYEEN